MNCVLRYAAIAVIAVILPVSVLAGTIGADYVGGGTQQNFDRATGYFFTPTVNVVVTSLGATTTTQTLALPIATRWAFFWRTGWPS